MRRWVAGTAVVLALASGCKDAFRARAEVAAEAGGQELSTDRLASLMAGIKGVPMSREAAEFIAGMWVDQTLFAQAVANRVIFMDQGQIVEQNEPKEFFNNPQSERTKLFLSQILGH